MTEGVIIFSSEFPPGPGGLGNHAYCLANNLKTEGFSLSAISVARERFDRDADTHFGYPVIKIKDHQFKLLKYIQLLRALHREVNRYSQPTVVASGMLMLTLLGAYSFFYKKRFKAIAIGHGIDINASNKIFRKLVDHGLRFCDKIIAVSQYTATRINPAFYHKTVVINNGFGTLALGITHGQIKKLQGNPSLITVGSISERKGQRNVVLSLLKIMESYPQVHYHSIGIDNQRFLITDSAKNLGIQDRITIHGAVKKEMLVPLLSASDIFMMLSDHTTDGDFEGFGIAILEANSLGVPAIGSRNSGIADAIRNGYSGYLVDPHNKDEVATAVQNIMNNYATFSSQAKLHAADYNWSVIVKKYVQEIKNIQAS